MKSQGLQGRKKGVNEKSIANLKKGGVISRDFLYKKISRLAPKAISMLDELMGEKYQDTVRMGAASKVLDKTLPNLEASKGDTNIQVVIPILGKEFKLNVPEDNSSIQDSTTG